MNGGGKNVENSHQKELALYTNLDEDCESCIHLTPTYALGFRSCGRTGIDFVSESIIIYSVAHHVVIYNLETRDMEFFQTIRHVKSVKSFQLSPNREFLAVAEVHHQNGEFSASKAVSSMTATSLPLAAPLKGPNVALRSLLGNQDRDVITIYEVGTKTRVKSLPLSIKSNIVSCSFSVDNKYLAVLEDAPNLSVVYWRVSDSKLVASCKCPSRGTRIHISPKNANVASISGPKILKFWNRTKKDSQLLDFLPHDKDQEQYVDHTWLKENMIALSDHGLVLCFRLGVDGCNFDLIFSSRCDQPSHVRMELITSHEKGFLLGGSAGFCSIYEATDDPKDPFSFVRSLSVGDFAFDCIAVSPSSETIVACSKSQELINLSMSAIDTEHEDGIEFCELVRHGHQVGSIVQVDVCVQRPIIVTCGVDKTVRVWNYEMKEYELLTNHHEEPTAIALHPSGFLLVVAFKERTRVYQVLHDSLRQLQELTIKACRSVRYANGGHLVACASGLAVTLYHAYTFEAVFTFSGHIGAVRCLCWSHDDRFLFSAANDGAIYRWDISAGSRSEEMQHIVKQCQYAAFVVDENDPTIVVASGSDGKIREIVAGEETKSFVLPLGVVITSMALMKDCGRLFVGTKAGSVLTYTWPLSDQGFAVDFAHAEGILDLRITKDNEQLITCAEDGSVGIFNILSRSLQRQEHGGLSSANRVSSSAFTERRKAGETYTDAVLIARDDLEERRAKVLEWQHRHDKAKADVDFALHRKESEWISRLQVLKEESEHLLIQERVRYEKLEACHQFAAQKHSEELAEREAHYSKTAQELENHFERKLAQEMTRYDALSETLEQTRQRCKALVEAQDSQSRSTLHAERMVGYTQAKEQNEVIKRLHEDVKYNHIKFEEVLHQEEVDYDNEMLKMRTEFAEQLDIERRNTAMKQGQVSAANTKLESLRKKLQELKTLSHARDVVLSTERAKVARLEETLKNYERHFEECRTWSHDKERTINDLKSDNRVLTKFRSVLSHRIDGLETEQAPLQTHLRSLKAQITEMQNELADEFRLKAETQQEMETKDAKLRTLLHEVKVLRQDLMQKKYSAGAMTREFTSLAQITNLKDLESAVKDAYKVYVLGETLQKKRLQALTSVSQSDYTRNTVSSIPRGSNFNSPAKTSTNKVANVPQNQQLLPVANALVSDEALGSDCKHSVDESAKQIEYMSRTIQTLQTALDHAKAQADRARRESVAEGSTLIDECNRLRKEKKVLQMQIRDLKRALCKARGNSSIDESLTGLDSSKLQLSQSSPQLHLASLSPLPQLDLPPTATARDCNRSIAQLHSDQATPSKQQRRQRTPKFAYTASPSHNSRTLLPFKRVERNRQSAARADDLVIIVEKQKRDIERLQKQIQLLLSGETDVPFTHHNISSSTSPHSQSLSLLNASQEGPMTVSRIGTLRPISSDFTPSPLQLTLMIPRTETDGGIGTDRIA